MGVFDGPPETQDRQRRMLIALLKWIYTTDIGELDVDDDYHLNLNESATAYGFEESKRYQGYEIQKKGRRMPVANIATWLCQLSLPSKHHMVFLFVELCEADKYLREHEPLPSLTRSCSFLQHVLSERLDQDGDLNPLIRQAGEEDVIDNGQEKLAHFIRACRNDVGHNFWLETEWGYTVHDHAATCVVTLLNSLLDSWYGVGWFVEDRLSTKRCIRIIEGEFGFEWDDEERYWDYDSIKPQYERLQDLDREGDMLLQNQYE